MRRPLIYYFISTFLGCLLLPVSTENYYIGAVVAASFLLVIYCMQDYKYIFICFAFLIFGCMSFKLYYSLKIPDKASIRVINKIGFNTIGSYEGRKIYLKGSTSRIDEGKIIYAQGTFSPDRDYSKGIIGTYNLKEYKNAKSDLISRTYEIKRKLYDGFEAALGEEKSALIMSLCFGDTEYLSKSQKNDFQNLGVIHAVSVSGFHISLIFMILESFLGLMPSMLISLFYVVFTGTQAAAVRALTMIIIAKISKQLYKNYDPVSSLSFAGIVIIAVNPYYVTDIGFSLSFLATLGILMYYKKISSSLFILPRKINESLSLTISAQLFSIPYISFTLQNFSFGFILGNMLLIPIYSVIVILGNLGFIFFKVSAIFGCICSVLKYVIDISDSVSNMLLLISPKAVFIGSDIGISMLLMYFSYTLYIHGRRSLRWFPAFLAATMAVKAYGFFPDIKYIGSEYAQCISVNYRSKSVLICSYDIEHGYELQNILKSVHADKIVTNIHNKTSVRICDDLYLETLDGNEDMVQLKCGRKSAVIPVELKNKHYISENKSSYDIMIPEYREWYLVSGKLFEIP